MSVRTQMQMYFMSCFLEWITTITLKAFSTYFLPAQFSTTIILIGVSAVFNTNLSVFY